MARIAGVDLPKEKRGVIGLTYIYGIGQTTAKELLAKANVKEDVRVKDWSEDQVAKIRRAISDYKLEGALRGEMQMNIKRLKEIGSYRGIRHRKGLPVRGQSTQTNCRTRKGRKKTVANKKKVLKK